MSITDNRKRNRILTVLFIGVLMGALDIAIVAPALPALQAGFGVGDRILAWTFTIYVLFNLIGTPLMAKLSDRTGRRTIYVLDVALFAAGSLVVALSPNFGVLLVNLPIALIVIVLALATLPSTRPAERRPFDWIGMAVLGVLLASLAFGINQLDTANFGASLVSPNVWAPLLLTIILIPVFVAAERRAADPVLRLSILGPRQAKLAAGLSAGAGLGEAGMVFMPQLAVAALGLGRSQASYILMPVVLAMAFGSPMAGRFLDKLGSKVVVFVGTTLLTLGMILLGLFNSSLGMFVVAGVVIGLGLSALLGAPIRYIMLNETATADRAAAQGVTSLFTSTGQLLSAVLVGAVAASQGGGVAGYSAAFLAIGAVSLVLTLLSLALKSRAAEVETMQRNQDVASVGLQS